MSEEKIGQANTELPACPYLAICWSFVGIYSLVVVAFGIVCAMHWPGKYILLGVVVIAPAVFYPILYFLLSNPDSRASVKTLGELWGPFWAALAGLCVLLAEKA